MTFPLLNRTLATFLSPELGFFGFVTPTRRHTPFISGQCEFANCGDVGFRARCPTLQPRMTWLYVADREIVVEKWRAGLVMAVKQVRVVAGRRRSALKREAMVGICVGTGEDGDGKGDVQCR